MLKFEQGRLELWSDSEARLYSKGMGWFTEPDSLAEKLWNEPKSFYLDKQTAQWVSVWLSDQLDKMR